VGDSREPLIGRGLRFLQGFNYNRFRVEYSPPMRVSSGNVTGTNRGSGGSAPASWLELFDRDCHPAHNGELAGQWKPHAPAIRSSSCFSDYFKITFRPGGGLRGSARDDMEPDDRAVTQRSREGHPGGCSAFIPGLPGVIAVIGATMRTRWRHGRRCTRCAASELPEQPFQ
jgi:hypothetical protein